ncbi:TetR/AcrR family transcriptional regulator [Actinoplanes derwentensis]|uniref:DNA-binding transcriptional regulator, AcrR family n=1 Tax=Actinoplanes derwentensis TaxID=113562 RepID=A0A1H2CX57_9ACTN|nr:TetR/AcrR family transcriptional regulator [Actinoplanes derwentensis]GID82809.1 TetR family transcriptional regulator [Actinoplanes derwentensis]SDT75085.1 DNA-binding transcriptional regulator, AcrR family [Actinoplanes derwentensis]
MSAATEQGLRERKKAATRQALHEAALRLALENGPDQVTVEAVADEAGVSRRTFSNYFANKEEAFFYGDRRRMRLLADLVRDRPADEPPWTALTEAAREFYAQRGDLDPEWVARGRLMRRHPALAAAHVQTFTATEHELSAEVAARLKDQDRFGVRAKLLAATFLAVLRTSLTVWLEHPSEIRFWDLASSALAEAGQGLSGLR